MFRYPRSPVGWSTVGLTPREEAVIGNNGFFQRSRMDLIDDIFKVVDRDGNQTIDKDELRRHEYLIKLVAAPECDIHTFDELFHRIDTDNYGALSLKELRDFLFKHGKRGLTQSFDGSRDRTLQIPLARAAAARDREMSAAKATREIREIGARLLTTTRTASRAAEGAGTATQPQAQGLVCTSVLVATRKRQHAGRATGVWSSGEWLGYHCVRP